MPEPSDLRNLLADATTEHEKAAAEPVQSEKPEPATEAQEKTDTPSGERPRGPDGKFLPKEASADDEEPREPPETEAEPGEEEEPPAVTEPAVDVPQHWSQADKDLVAKLPAEHRQAVVDRYKAIEAGFTPKLQRAAELEKQFGGAQEVFAPYADVLRQRNQTPSDIVKVWASVEQGFIEGWKEASEGRPNQKGAQLVANLIRQYRVDPGAVAAILQGQSAPPSTNGAGNPYEGSLPPEILQKINRIDAIEAREAERENFARQQRMTAAQHQIDTFAAEKDAQGNLLHPYYAQLETEISRLAKLDADDGRPIDLADLYDRAAHANRETREKLLAAREAEAKQKAAADRKAKAAAAQRASSSVTGSPGSGQSPNEQRRGTRSLREELETNAADFEAA